MRQRLNFSPASLLAVPLLLALSACGGGGGGGGTTTSFSGAVIDGYIANAKVCLDVNANLECDAAEPTDFTDAEGNYSFEYTGNTAGMHVLALVTEDSIDSDTGPVTEPFSLLAPAEKPKAITPLTTLVSSDMIETGSSATDAEASVKVALNTTKNLLDYDFKEANDTDTLAVAQVTALALANAKEAIKADASGAALSSADVLKAAVAQVNTNVLPNVLSADGKLTFDISTASSQAEIDTKLKAAGVDVKTVVAGNIRDIISRTKAGPSEELNMEQVFKDGFMVVEEGSATLAADDGSKGDYITDALKVEHIKYDSSAGGSPFGNEKVLSDSDNGSSLVWKKQYDWPDDDYYFDGKSWLRKTDGGESISFEDNCVIFSDLGKSSSVSEKFCGVKKDLVGKKITDFVPDLCSYRDDEGNEDAAAKLRKASCNTDATFPAGSFGVDLTRTVSADSYRIYGSDSWEGYEPSLEEFLVVGSNHWLGEGCNTYFGVTEVTKGSSGKVVSGKFGWARNNSEEGCTNAERNDFTETTAFEVVQVGDKSIVKVVRSNVYRKANPGDREPFTIFGEVANTNGVVGVFEGDMTPAKTKITIPFTGDPSRNFQVLTPQAFDAIINEMGIPAFPYSE
jgi:hypothetical protein